MKTASSIFSFKWFVKTSIKSAAILFVLVLIIVVSKNYLSQYIAPKSYGLNGLSEFKELDYLFIGSSHTRQSYDIKLFEKLCKCRAYSLSYSGLDPYFISLILPEILKEVVVKNLIIESYSLKMIAKPRLSDSRVFSHGSLEIKKQIIQGLDHLNVPRKEIVSLIVNENNDDFLSFFITNSILSKFSYRGGYTNKVMKQIEDSEFANSGKNVDLSLEPKINVAQVSALSSIISTAKSSDNVFFIEPPMPAPVFENRITQLGIDTFKKELASYGFKYINLWLDGEKLKERRYFHDWNHLSTLGRDVFTKDVFNFLNVVN